jgi:hypothetical protein
MTISDSFAHAEHEEKLRIKGYFGVTVAAKARVRTLNLSSFFGFFWPCSRTICTPSHYQVWRITVDAGEKE